VEDLGVDDGIVERQGNLEDGQDGDQGQPGRPTVEQGEEQAHDRDAEGPPEGAKNHARISARSWPAGTRPGRGGGQPMLTPKSIAMPARPEAYPCPTARNFHSPLCR